MDFEIEEEEGFFSLAQAVYDINQTHGNATTNEIFGSLMFDVDATTRDGETRKERLLKKKETALKPLREWWLAVKEERDRNWELPVSHREDDGYFKAKLAYIKELGLKTKTFWDKRINEVNETQDSLEMGPTPNLDDHIQNDTDKYNHGHWGEVIRNEHDSIDVLQRTLNKYTDWELICMARALKSNDRIGTYTRKGKNMKLLVLNWELMGRCDRRYQNKINRLETGKIALEQVDKSVDILAKEGIGVLLEDDKVVFHSLNTIKESETDTKPDICFDEANRYPQYVQIDPEAQFAGEYNKTPEELVIEMEEMFR